MMDSTFVLDANVFIEAARRYYAFDLVPGFWEKLIRHAESGRIQSIDRVSRELERGKDELATWAREHFARGFASTYETDIIQAYSRVINWVQAQERFSTATKASFAAGADGWLVAYALVKRCVVVTQEIPAPDGKNVKIPDVCMAFTVHFCDTFQMLRSIGILFR